MILGKLDDDQAQDVIVIDLKDKSSVADFMIVAASNGVVAVPAKAAGMKITPMNGMDLTRKLYRVEFHNTPCEKIGDAGAIRKALDIATTALVALAALSGALMLAGGDARAADTAQDRKSVV